MTTNDESGVLDEGLTGSDEGLTGSDNEGLTAFNPDRFRKPDLGYTSGSTRWARGHPSKGGIPKDRRWHGFPMLASTPDGRHVSYCGAVRVDGVKRATSPPRIDAVCQRCADACDFRRRPSRKTGRERGSRRLGTTMERMDQAMDGLYAVIERLEAVMVAVAPAAPARKVAPTPAASKKAAKAPKKKAK